MDKESKMFKDIVQIFIFREVAERHYRVGSIRPYETLIAMANNLYDNLPKNIKRQVLSIREHQIPWKEGREKAEEFILNNL